MSRRGNTATQRLKQDYLHIMRDPVPYITAHPLSSNILEWHYVFRGPEGTPYHNGYYHGKLVFSSEFPFKPPSIYILTPNGRFNCNTRLCLSISDFHPNTWNPSWSVATILTGLLSFMVEKKPTLGSLETPDYKKRQLAAQSLDFNLKDRIFVELFPDVVDEIKEQLRVAKIQAMMRDESDEEEPGEQRNGMIGSALANVVVIVGFAAFAYIVKYVLNSIAK